MELVAREVPTASLLLVGSERDEGYATSLRKEISARGLARNVSFLGARPGVAGILEQCDIGVLSSTSEGLPLALIEYGAARLAAVATDVGQCREVLDNGCAGCLVPPGAPDKLGAALLSLLRSPELRAELALKLQKRVGTHYTEQRVLEKICRLYEDAVT
jgi:glycosyltransferase involved in cell wall biosynthesis